MFQFYPKIYYRINDYDYLRVKDISIYTKIKDYVSSYAGITQTNYNVESGETPDYVSYKLYGTPKFDYILLILNDIRNVYDEWPRNRRDLEEYIEEKYGSMAYAQSNYANYYRSDGVKISKDMWFELVDSGKYFESYYEYEERLNREKGQIKVMSYNYAVNFEVQLQEYLNNVVEIT